MKLIILKHEIDNDLSWMTQGNTIFWYWNNPQWESYDSISVDQRNPRHIQDRYNGSGIQTKWNLYTLLLEPNVYFLELEHLSDPKFLEWLQEKDEDWKEVKPNELITEMRNIQKQWVEDLKKQGVSYAERIEWIYEPDFNEQDNFVNYSYEVFWNGENKKYKTMQTNSIVLGRKGYIELSFVKKIFPDTTNAEMKEFANFAKEFTADVIYKDGSKHTDYKSGDKIAALGIGGLVAGTLGVKVLAKAGILAKFLPLLAKFWWIIIAPIVAIFAFAGKKNSSGASGADKESISRRRER